MVYRRAVLRACGVKSASELKGLPIGKETTTDKKIIFMTLEDETGTARVIISPDFYDKNRMAVLNEHFVLVSGVVQNQNNIVHLKAQSIQRVTITQLHCSSQLTICA